MIKANDFRSSIRRHGTSNRKFSHSKKISKKIRQHVQQMPFFENTEVLRRDVQVLDHILTMEIKTHFILNLPRPKISKLLRRTPAQPGLLKPLGFTGGRTPPAHFPLFGIRMLCNRKQHIAVYISRML